MPPLIKGGQGRDADAVTDSARYAFYAGVVLLLAAVVKAVFL